MTRSELTEKYEPGKHNQDVVNTRYKLFTCSHANSDQHNDVHPVAYIIYHAQDSRLKTEEKNTLDIKVLWPNTGLICA